MVDEDRERIERLEAEGKISAEEAGKLKEAIDRSGLREEAEAPPGADRPAAPGATAAAPASGLAIACLVLAVAGVVIPLLWPVALVLGVVALIDIRKRPAEISGRGFAIAGMAVSAVGIAALVVFFGFFLLLLGVNAPKRTTVRSIAPVVPAPMVMPAPAVGTVAPGQLRGTWRYADPPGPNATSFQYYRFDGGDAAGALSSWAEAGKAVSEAVTGRYESTAPGVLHATLGGRKTVFRLEGQRLFLERPDGSRVELKRGASGAGPAPAPGPTGY